MNKNQYIKIDKKIEEIIKMDIDFYSCNYDSKNSIEELELIGDENVLIYRTKEEKRDKNEFINIFSGIKIMITTINEICDDKYMNLPSNIEYVIIDKIICDIKNEFNTMDFMSRDRLEGYIKNEIIYKKENINTSDIFGSTALIMACWYNMEEVAMELIEMMTDEAISKSDKNGYTALFCACDNKMEKVAIKLISRMTIKSINRKFKNSKGYIDPLRKAIINNMEGVILEMIRRMSYEKIQYINSVYRMEDEKMKNAVKEINKRLNNI